MIDVTKLKVGDCFYNADRDYIGFITDIMGEVYHYTWVCQTKAEPYGKCKVKLTDMIQYSKSWREVSPLIKELL